MSKPLNTDDKIRILKKREYVVVKANDLIQKTRFNLSVPEQRMIAYICSMIKPRTAEEKANNEPYVLEYEIDIRDYCKVCDMDYDNGKNYQDIKALIKGLRDKSMWVDFGETEILCAWLSKAKTNKKSGIAQIKIDEDLAPFLYDLSEKFTEYQLYNILEMKSQYSIRFYELFKSHEWKKHTTMDFDIDELKRLLMVEDIKSYSNFKDFRKKVLEPAISEINEQTDLIVSFSTVNKGRKVIMVKFAIRRKTYPEMIEQSRKKNKER